MTVEELINREEEIKNRWLQNQGKPIKEVFSDFGELGWRTPESMWFAKYIGIWQRELYGSELKNRAEKMTPEELEKMLELNRRRAVIMLNDILVEYENNPRRLRGVDIKEVSRLYSIIKSSEEQTKRTDIAFHKEKRETVQMILPYQRLNEDQLKLLREKANVELTNLAQPAQP